ncbi:MAG: tetratricopeptide repeat protein [Ardenticatenaceae bacterium]|nr:tetratricopeptide repeat protein [Ardenticatenaceae bacterium]
MNEIALQRAMVIFEQAYRAQQKGEIAEAVRLYQKSIEIHATPEAHTFLGWAYSMLELYDQAIAECEAAIELDPEYGNPYNDIGSYLISLGRPEEALEWLDQAAQAGRYDAPQYPHINKAQAYEMMGRYRSALKAYDAALAIDPFDVTTHLAKYALIGEMN